MTERKPGLSKAPRKGDNLATKLAYGFDLGLKSLAVIENFNPGAAAAAQVAIAVVRIIQSIVSRHGAAGLAEARRRLEELDRAGPQGITDTDLASDDAALDAEIRGWYAESSTS